MDQDPPFFSSLGNEAGITVALPNPRTAEAKSKGRFGERQTAS
jgi:hypothetical protein